VNSGAVACFRPGCRPHLFCKLRVYRRRKGELKRKLKKIQYRRHLIDGCRPGTGLTRET
jgi:hypothetical protein